MEEDKKNCRTTQLSHMFFPPPSIFFGYSVCKNSFHFPNAYKTFLQDWYLQMTLLLSRENACAGWTGLHFSMIFALSTSLQLQVALPAFIH